MILGLFGRGRSPESEALYGQIVEQARQPAFYSELGVEDTVNGRFDLIVLHLWLLLRRLSEEGQEGRALSQEVFDAFFRDMDRSLREMGVGDLSVPKRIKRMAQAFYGRSAAYDAALSSEEQLARALARNLLGEEGRISEGRILGTYVLAAIARLSGTPRKVLFSGSAPFPEPGPASSAGGSP